MEEHEYLKLKIELDKKLQIVKKVLDNVVQIMEIFKPLLDKVLELEESKEFSRNGMFNQAITLLGEITDQCRLLEQSPHSEKFLKDLKN